MGKAEFSGHSRPGTARGLAYNAGPRRFSERHRCVAAPVGPKTKENGTDLLGPQNRPYRPTTIATATTAITGSARVASVGFHGVYELAVYARASYRRDYWLPRSSTVGPRGHPSKAHWILYTTSEGSCHPARIGIGPIWIGMSRAGRGGCEYCFRRDPLRFQPALVRFHPRPYGFSRLKP